MNELTQEMANFEERMAPVDTGGYSPTLEELALRRQAINWATHALETYRGDLLQKALAVSSSIADFLAAFEESARNGE